MDLVQLLLITGLITVTLTGALVIFLLSYF
jgi:hypothetical protein